MKTLSAAVIVAVMSAAALADARAQNFIPRGPELNFIRPGGSVMPCSHHAIYTNAVRGALLCGEASSGGESGNSGHTGMFLDDPDRAFKERKVHEAGDRPKDHDGWGKGGKDHDDWEKGGTDKPHVGGGGDERFLDPGQSNPELAIAAISVNAVTPSTPVIATPEPTSFALMATGLLGVAAYRRRRTKGKEGINN